MFEPLEASAKRLLEIVGSEPGTTCDTRQHVGADLSAVMKREYIHRPPLALKDAVRTGLMFDCPADTGEGCKNTARV